jgi:hypothetical protein
MGYWVFIMSFASLTWALIERPGQRLGLLQIEPSPSHGNGSP